MRTELRPSDQYALKIIRYLHRCKGAATWRMIHEAMVRQEEILPHNRGATSKALVKLYRRGAIHRIICSSSDGRYAYKSK